MSLRVRVCAAGAAIAMAALAAGLHVSAQAASGTGVGMIRGRIKLAGKDPGNPVIRMNMDPMCVQANAGRRVVDEAIMTSDDGGLREAFVKVEGSFPATKVPAAPVVIDQKSCVYVPRVVGARVGQVLRIKNDDNLLHNVHAFGMKAEAFNVGQPMAGMHYDFTLKDEEMLHLKCDVHRWMTTWVGVVSHPYFAVSGNDGAFTISGVPSGKQTVSVWHEKLGMLKQTVDVKPGGTATVAFTYPEFHEKR